MEKNAHMIDDRSSTKMRYIFKPQTNHHPFFNVKMLSKDSKGINVGVIF